MKIACLQLDSIIREVDLNIRTADRILSNTSSSDALDLLVLPELAFTGYNYPTATSIKPYLEPTAAGVSTQWAIRTAKRLSCFVIVGYPELSSEIDDQGRAISFNSTVTVSPQGEVVAQYRKSFLYYTDEIWAAEGSGFFCGTLGSLGVVSHGICMDINPYRFVTPWESYEFANHGIKNKASLVVLSTAWITHASLEELEQQPRAPDLETMSYWASRFFPLTELNGSELVTVVFANRIGTERNDNRAITTKSGQVVDLGDTVSYAGSSCVMQFSGQQAYVCDVLGACEEGLLTVDTTKVGAPIAQNSINADNV